MKHRHTPFRHVLDQMTLDLTEAVLGAVREAARAALVGGAPSFGAIPTFAPAVTAAVAPDSEEAALHAMNDEASSHDQEASAEARPSRRAPVSGTRRTARVVVERSDDFDDSIADEPSEATIIDPMSMLAALESAAVRPAEPTSRGTVTSSLLADRDVRSERRKDEEAPVSAAPSTETPRKNALAFAPRTGEEVIRTSTGGLVLRRRRGTAAPAA